MFKKFVKMLRLIKQSAYVIYEWPPSTWWWPRRVKTWPSGCPAWMRIPETGCASGRPHSWTRCQKPVPAKNEIQNTKKSREIDWFIIKPATVWQILNMKSEHVIWPETETEVMWIFWKFAWKKLVKSFGGVLPFVPAGLITGRPVGATEQFCIESP